jgi:isopenicillin N synthase-like dioxygenase
VDADGAIPCIDIHPLFGGPADSRDAVDRVILAAATGSGFMTVSGLPASVPIDAGTRRDLLRIFSLPAQAVPRPQTPIYRGWFPLRDDADCCVEAIDIGPDVAYGPAVTDRTDALRERTPLPPDDVLPGWTPTAGRYYRDMERTAEPLMRGIARGLGLAEDIFDAAFSGGISTLRLARYPARGNRDTNALSAHADLGLVTLLAQDGIAGLQARSRDGTWRDVPPREGTLVVNFGKLLGSWTGGRIRATEHRVLAPDRERFSIPFFYEPRVDAEIAPLPVSGGEAFVPFRYGDYVRGTSRVRRGLRQRERESHL